ncbi:hypothetical protein [Microbacterium oleivorans]|uniref:hypothetical protein n=1 Tax=Microbacterium oleivorans TaxID=273677 RepID=UPI00080E983A|nr:hypothetical protein [Microbacterium oleivorans]
MGVTIFLACLPQDTVSTPLVSALLVILAAVLQGGSAFTFGSIGRADPSLARTAVRRLIDLTATTQRARVRAETAYENATASEMKSSMGLLTVELAGIEEGVASAALDWAEFHPEAIKKLQEKDQ